MEKYVTKQLIYFYDKETGLKAITCIHDTTLGPALGVQDMGIILVKKKQF